MTTCRMRYASLRVHKNIILYLGILCLCTCSAHDGRVYVLREQSNCRNECLTTEQIKSVRTLNANNTFRIDLLLVCRYRHITQNRFNEITIRKLYAVTRYICTVVDRRLSPLTFISNILLEHELRICKLFFTVTQVSIIYTGH